MNHIFTLRPVMTPTEVQTASCATLRAILMRAVAEIAALEFPCGEPSRHYDVADMEGHIMDLAPTWIAAQMTDFDRAFDAIQQRHDALRGL